MAVLFAILTATANAVALATQHVASTSGRSDASGWRFVLFLLRHPLWLFGWLALGASLVFQALALHFGPMSLVQPFLVAELVIALVLRRVWIRQSIRPVTWAAAAATTIGLTIFLATTSPHAPGSTSTSTAWTAPVITCFVVTGALVVSGWRGSPSRRAACFASATAVLWALEATFIKTATNTFTAHGLTGSLARWPFYAFVVGGVAGLVCEQTALHVGPLKVSQPFIVIVDPIVSIGLGLWLFHERLTGGALHLGVGVVAFAAMCAGVLVLTKTAPDSMRAEPHFP